MSAFDRSERFQQELPDILTAIAAPRVPDYTDDLLAHAAATRQRPRWTFLEQWLPAGTVARRLHVAAVPWRPIVVLTALILLLVAVLLVAGSQQRVPPPFGPARNGALAYGNGDIYLRDRIEGASKLVIGGPADDFAATFTRDGTRLMFLRRVAGAQGSPSERMQMFLADRDGSNVVAVTEPMISPYWTDVAPDDSFAVVTAGDAQIAQNLYVADLRHPGTARQLDVGDPGLAASVPSFLGPTGAEIVFRGTKGAGTGKRHGLFAVRPDGTGLRPLTPLDGDPDTSYLMPQSSPDGRYVAYTEFDPSLQALRIHLVDLRAGGDRIFTDIGRTEAFATFSPDSSRIIFRSYLAPGRRDRRDRYQVQVAPVDGSAYPLAIGPSYRVGEDDSLSYMFSPDGKWVIVADPASGETRIVDAATGGDGEILPWSAADISGWQRLAP